MVDRRSLFTGLACLTAGLSLSGCGAAGGSSGEDTGSYPEHWVTCSIGGLSAIDPVYASNRAGVQVLQALYCPLTKLVDGAIEPYFARSFEMAEDALACTFHLPEDAFFSNGEAITALSFKRAWERIVRPLAEGPSAGSEGQNADQLPRHSRWCTLLSAVEGYDAAFQGRASELVGLRCPDDYTLSVTLTRPLAYFPEIASHPALGPVPKVSESDQASFAAEPVGNGPFRLSKSWKDGDDVLLERNDACVWAAPRVEGLVFVGSADTVAAYNQFQAGKLDVSSVPVDQFEDAAKAWGASAEPSRMKPGERFARGAESGLVYLLCNTSVAPFDRVELRQAVSYAIDRESLCRKVLNASAEPAMNVISPCMGSFEPWASCSYDIEYASSIVDALVAASQESPVSDVGSFEGEAEPVEPPVLECELVCRKGGVMGKVATQVAADVKGAGLTMKVAALESEKLLSRLHSGDFQCALIELEPAVASPSLIVADLFGRYASRWEGEQAGSEELSRSIAEIESGAFRIDRDHAAAAALKIAGELLSVIPVAHPMYAKAASARVEQATVLENGCIDATTIELT